MVLRSGAAIVFQRCLPVANGKWVRLLSIDLKWSRDNGLLSDSELQAHGIEVRLSEIVAVLNGAS